MKTKTKREYTEYELKLKKYYRLCFLSEFSKILIFFLIFLFLRLVPEYFISLLFLLPLRNHGGGLHFNHYITCLIVSFSFLCGSIFLALYVTPSKIFMCITCLVCIMLGYHLVPVTSSNRPPATAEQVRKSKRNTAIILTLFSAIICICPYHTFWYIGYWTIILHISQLILSHILKEVTSHVRLGHQIWYYQYGFLWRT